MSEILDDMFDEALKLEQESDDTDEHCGEIVLQTSEFIALHEEIRLLKACIFSCLQSDSYEYIKERMELEEKRWEEEK